MIWNPFHKKNDYHVGIDIGTSSVKVVELSREANKPKLTNYGAFYTIGQDNAIQSRSRKILDSQVAEILQQIVEQKEEALAREHYKKALLLKNRQKLIEQTANSIKNEHAPRHRIKKITPETVYQVVAEMTSIPISALMKGGGGHIKDLESTLAKHIVGQPYAIQKIAQALRRNHTGIRKAQRPIGSYLFMGPSGVGKTSLAQVLASALAGREVNETRPATLIKLDMSELSEAHTVARLIGAPPGLCRI